MSKGLHAMQLPPQQAAMATGELHAAGKSQRAAICLLHVAASGTQVVFFPFCIGYKTSSSSGHVSTQSLRSNAMKPPCENHDICVLRPVARTWLFSARTYRQYLDAR